MFILARSPAVALLLLVALPAMSEAAAQQPLSHEEIVTLFTGKRLEYRTTRVPDGPPAQPTGWHTLPALCVGAAILAV